MHCLKKFSKFILVFLCCYAQFALAEPVINADTNAKTSNYLAHYLKNNKLLIDTSEGQLTITFFDLEAVEVVFSSVSQKQLPSYSIATSPKFLSLTLKEDKQKLSFSSSTLTVKINKQPLRLSFFKNNQLLSQESLGLFANNTARGVSFKLDKNEKILGGGERVLGMDRRGHRLPLYNRAHYGYTTESKQMNFGLPAIMSSKKYLILFDNTAKGFIDIGKNDQDILQFEAMAGRSSYLFFSGDSFPKLINNYVNITGKQPMPPRWAFGNFASRFGYHSEQEARDVVNQYQALDFPLDAIIFDLYWFGKELIGTMGNLDWDRDAFPTAEKMIKDFNHQGVKTLLITEPFVLTTSSKWQDAAKNNALALDQTGKPKVYNFYFGETSIIDVFSDSGQEWFWQTYDKLLKQGVAAWWGDLGEPEVHPSDTLHAVGSADEIHNVYGHKWAEMIFERQLTAYPNKRPFLLMRSGFAGSQRFGMMPWTGDVSRSWGGLKPQVELSLQMGLFGLAYTHSDLGGFAGDEQNNELYIRWLQYGVFQPIFRPHAQETVPSEPIFYPKDVQDIVRKFIKLRYQLLPYNYTLAYQNSMSGMPLMRPVFFEDEDRLELIDNKDSYLWGDAFFVVPITDGISVGIAGDISNNKPTITTQVNLPRGVWFNFFDDTAYQGGQSIAVENTLSTLPVFVRAGSFVPMIDTISSTQNYSTEQLNLHYYADSSISQSHYQMYEDNGKTYQAHLRGQYELLNFTAKQEGKQLTIALAKQLAPKLTEQAIPQTKLAYQGMPEQREMLLIIHNWQQLPKNIKLNSTTSTEQLLSIHASLNILKSSSSGFYYDSKKRQLHVKFIWQHQKLILQVN